MPERRAEGAERAAGLRQRAAARRGRSGVEDGDDVVTLREACRERLVVWALLGCDDDDSHRPYFTIGAWMPCGWPRCSRSFRSSGRGCSTTSAAPPRGRAGHAGALGRARRPHEHPPRRGARGRVLLLVPRGADRRAARLHRPGLRLPRRAGAARADAGARERRARARGPVPRALRPRAGRHARRHGRAAPSSHRDERRRLARARAGRRDARRTTSRAAGSRSCARRSTGDRVVAELRRPASPATAAPASRPASKWEAVAREPARAYVIVNADEGEPGTIKDRYVMELRPHLHARGDADRDALRGGDARGSSTCARSTRPLATRCLRAIEELREAGLLDGLLDRARRRRRRRTSAARRRRCSSRWRAGAGCRG